MDTILIRPAGIGDAQQIAEVRVRSWQSAYQGLIPQATLDNMSVEDEAQRQRRWFGEGRAYVLVAEMDGKVVGIATVGKIAEEDHGGPAGQLFGLYIHPDHWRCGVGRSLWPRIVEHARGMGWSWLFLGVLTQNDRACRFYEAMGGRADCASIKTIQIEGSPAETVRYWFPLREDQSMPESLPLGTES